MSGHELDQAIHAALETLYARLDALDHERLDLELSDGKLVAEIEGGPRIIVNRQGAAGQVWVAEPGGGWHFDRTADGRWVCAKRGVELFASLSELFARVLGGPVDLT